jgi:hypothetical protein
MAMRALMAKSKAGVTAGILRLDQHGLFSRNFDMILEIYKPLTFRR